MRATCKQWKEDLDAAMHSLSPAICKAQDIVSLFPNVEELDLSACNVTVDDDSLAIIAKLPRLQTLDISGCARVGFPSPHVLSWNHGQHPQGVLLLSWRFH